MPKITQQNHKQSIVKKQSGSILSRGVEITKMVKAPLKVCTYGRGKTGKTRVASTFPKPLCIVGAEDGTKSISNVEGITFYKIVLRADQAPPDGNYVLYSELPQFTAELMTSEFKSVCLDNASSLQDIVLADMLGMTEVPVQWNPSQLAVDWGRDTRTKYGIRALRTKEILVKFLALPQNVNIIAHEKNFNEEEEHSDLLSPDVGAALSKSTAGWLNGAVDYICQTFIRQQTEESAVEGTDMKIQTPTGVKEFCLRIGPHEIFQTGFRVSPGIKIPDVIIDPSYPKIMSVINNTYFSKNER